MRQATPAAPTQAPHPLANESHTAEGNRVPHDSGCASKKTINSHVLLGPGLIIATNIARLQEIHSSLSGLHLGLITGMISLMAILTAKPDRTLKPILAFSQTKIYLMLIAVALLSIPDAAWPSASLKSIYTALPMKCMLYYGILRTVQNESDFILLNSILVFCISLIAGLSLFSSRERFNVGLTYDANELGLILCTTFPLAYFLWRTTPGSMKLFWMFCVGSILIGIISTVSRGAFICICIIAPYTMFRDKTIGKAKILFILCVAVILFFSFVSDNQLDRLLSIFNSETDYNYSHRGGRLEIWKRGLDIYFNNPFLGIGYDGFINADGKLHESSAWLTAHNFIIQIAAELGTFGLVLFSMLIFKTYKDLLIMRDKKILISKRLRLSSVALETSLHAFIISAMFLSQAYSNMLLYIVLCTIILLRLNSRKAIQGSVPNGQ